MERTTNLSGGWIGRHVAGTPTFELALGLPWRMLGGVRFGSWDSGGIRPGEKWSARFDLPGLYPFLCGPHPFMKGVVLVR